MDHRVKWPVCGWGGCHRLAGYSFYSDTTERLSEQWSACHYHKFRVMTYIIQRDINWGIDGGPVHITQLSRA
jgi:hypothetical protein